VKANHPWLVAPRECRAKKALRQRLQPAPAAFKARSNHNSRRPFWPTPVLSSDAFFSAPFQQKRFGLPRPSCPVGFARPPSSRLDPSPTPKPAPGSAPHVPQPRSIWVLCACRMFPPPQGPSRTERPPPRQRTALPRPPALPCRRPRSLLRAITPAALPDGSPALIPESPQQPTPVSVVVSSPVTHPKAAALAITAKEPERHPAPRPPV